MPFELLTSTLDSDYQFIFAPLSSLGGFLKHRCCLASISLSSSTGGLMNVKQADDASMSCEVF